MSIIALPSDMPIRRIQWELDRPAQVNVSAWTGIRTVMADPWHGKWRAKIEFSPIVGESNVLAWRAFLAKLKGTVNCFRLYATENDQNANSGVTLSANAAAGATTATITGAATTLLAGQFITINGQLLQLTENQSGSTLTFEPQLRFPALSGATVTTSRPYALVYLTSGAAGWAADAGQVYGIAFDVEEAVGETDSAPSEAAAPVNTVLPAITGVAIVDETLSTSNGTWTNGPPTFTYQWKRAGTPIGGATSQTYTLVEADAGSTITSTVTATIATSVSATSAATAAVFSPTSLFGGTDRGIILDFTDKGVLFQNSGGTGAVAAAGDPIGYVGDKGPLAKNAIQATAGSRPFYGGVPRTWGAELANNGQFDTGASWTAGTGWTLGSGVATKAAGTGSSLSEPLTLTVGQAYIVTYSITRTAGTLTPQFTGGTTVSGYARALTGSYVDIIFAASGNTTLGFLADATFAGTLDRVSVKPVSTWVNYSAMFDGVDDRLQTAAVDLSNQNKLTVILAAYYDAQTLGARDVVEVGNALSGTAGSFLAEYATPPRGILKGSSGTAQNDFGGGATSGDGRMYVSTFELDPAQATIAAEITHRLAGAGQTGTTSGTVAGAGNFCNDVITVGSAKNSIRFWKDRIRRIFVINRALNTTERSNVEKWVTRGIAYCAVLGDSTSAYISAADALPIARSTASLMGGIAVGLADVSHAGDKIADQKTAWTAIADKSALEAVFIQVGLNDCNTYAGAGGTRTVAQITADVQDLVATVNAAKPAGCKTYICTMTPGRVWLGTAPGSVPATAYALWQGVNANIAGTGANPITGVDGRITGHTTALDDGSGNLKTEYDFNNDGVHESTAARLVIAQYWRAQLEADGLV